MGAYKNKQAVKAIFDAFGSENMEKLMILIIL